MKKDPLDRWLQGATFAVALVRVLRGDDPKAVVADVERMNERATALRQSIDNIGAAAPSSTEGSKPDVP